MKRYIFTASIIVLAALLINLPLLNRFTISNSKTGEIVYIDTIDNAEEFTVSFRHSVNRTPVNEFVRIRENKFIVYKTTFYSYGAGMPEYDRTSRQKVTINDGVVLIENIDRELESFTYLVGTYADHTLSILEHQAVQSLLTTESRFFQYKKVSLLKINKYLLNAD